MRDGSKKAATPGLSAAAEIAHYATQIVAR
jgi:hypothetical protein